MHIGFIPYYTDSIGDILWIQDAMRFLLKRIRATAPTIANGWGTCKHCRNEAIVDYHHVRPLWSLATEAIVIAHPQSLRDLGQVTLDAHRGCLDILVYEPHAELIPLCPRCHAAETKVCNQKWKQELSGRYPLLWSYLFKIDEFEAIVKKSYEVSPCP